MMHRLVFMGLAALAAAFSSGIDAPPAEPVKAQFRDAVASGGLLFAAVYDRDAVWVYDRAARTRTAEIAVGDGPAALALSADGHTLACANRLANTVSLIDLATLTVNAAAPTQDGPSDIAALPDGRFAAANTFGDSFTLIDPARPDSPETIAAGGLVPTALAVSGDRLLAIGQGGVRSALYALPGLTDPQAAPVQGAPRSVAALDGGRFAIATDIALYVVGANGAIAAERAGAVVALAADGGALYALEAGALVRLDAQLAPAASMPLDGPAELAFAGGGAAGVLSPRAKTWQWSAVDVPVVTAQAPEAPSEPEAAPDSEPAPEVSAEPAVEAAAPEDRSTVETPVEEAPSAPADADAPVEAPAAEAVPEAPPAEAEAPAEPAQPGRGVRGLLQKMGRPLSTAPADRETAAERRPVSSPMGRLDSKTIAQAVIQPTEFGSPEAGFQPPDWREPFRDIQADQMRQELGSDRTELKGNVRMNLGEMHFGADEFAYSRDLGQISAAGNVSVDQQNSRLRATSFEYMIAGDAVAEPEVFETTEAEQAFARRRLGAGRLKASDVRIEEPTRQMSADAVDFDFSKTEGELHDVRGRAGIFYYGAEKLVIKGEEYAEAEQVWVTTCDHDPPHYRLMHKKAVFENGTITRGTHARLMLGRFNTPAWIPRWRRPSTGTPFNMDWDTGRRAEIGSYLNLGLLFEASPDIEIGPRFFVTSTEGLGLGGDAYYDFMESPASPLFRSKGELHGLYTTKDRGYTHWYHRYQPSDQLVIRLQAEQWSDEDFYKDFYFEEYRHRTTPRNFANLTFREDTHITTATVQPNTHAWVNETEKQPEATFHLLERPIARQLYLSFDTVNGYYDDENSGPGAGRTVNVARLTYSIDKLKRVSITPYAQLEVGAYTRDLDDEDGGSAQLSGVLGTTLQSRLHRAYDGRWGFDGFKHIILPSVTLSYRPGALANPDDLPYFDAYDKTTGRFRIESKLENVLYGRDAKTGESWQVGRLTLYTGNDLWNEESVVQDYEIEMDIRPRPWWGIQAAAERHQVSDELPYDNAARFANAASDFYEERFNSAWDEDLDRRLERLFPDYNRVLINAYYDDMPIGGRLQGRIGFALTDLDDRQLNRDLLYGFGIQITENWYASFEHIFDIASGDLRQQTYEIRRALHCWEAGLRFRERESGFDVNLVLGIRAFPGSRMRF